MSTLKDNERSVTDINDEFFGKDKSRNYLKHDFRRVLEGFVQREVLLHVAIECSKKRHNKKESKDETGNIVSIAYGDYDPDNAGFLFSVLKNHELGVMIDMRLLLTKNESGAGGKFIKDITQLQSDDFINYYKFSEENKTIIPHLLIGKLIEGRKDGKAMKANDLIDSNTDQIKQVVDELVSKARKFNGCDYSKTIIMDYQALKFHKDRQPEKYEVTESRDGQGVFNMVNTTRRDKSKIETQAISKALNEFAEIIALYQLLVSKDTSFFGSSWPLDTHIQRTFALFRKNIPSDIQQKVVDDIVKHLRPSLNVTGWQITDAVTTDSKRK